MLVIFPQKQIEGCKRVTDAVHAKGAYCQLWHVGRVTTPSFLAARTHLIPATFQSLATTWTDHPTLKHHPSR